MIKVTFLSTDQIDEKLLKYAVIVAASGDKWVFCRHRERASWELPGGHREAGEEIDSTALRELHEETGAVSAAVERVAIYCVCENGNDTYGMLYYSEIHEFEKLVDAYEIAEIALLDDIPSALTYPLIQPHLFRFVLEQKGLI